ncbi:hypothetical protein AWN88_11180 [Agrobacterium tumefaciens]|nr:hypothetical protein AWN88_11180 [Agrobacterium tumefaciens]
MKKWRIFLGTFGVSDTCRQPVFVSLQELGMDEFPILKPVLELFCLCRLSGRKWGSSLKKASLRVQLLRSFLLVRSNLKLHFILTGVEACGLANFVFTVFLAFLIIACR